MAHLYDKERFTKQQAYNLDKWDFGFVHGVFEVGHRPALRSKGVAGGACRQGGQWQQQDMQ